MSLAFPLTRTDLKNLSIDRKEKELNDSIHSTVTEIKNVIVRLASLGNTTKYTRHVWERHLTDDSISKIKYLLQINFPDSDIRFVIREGEQNLIVDWS